MRLLRYAHLFHVVDLDHIEVIVDFVEVTVRGELRFGRVSSV